MLKTVLSTVRSTCQNRRITQKDRERFFWKPLQFTRSLFEQPWSDSLEVGKEELENYLMESYFDALKNAPPSETDGLAN